MQFEKLIYVRYIQYYSYTCVCVTLFVFFSFRCKESCSRLLIRYIWVILLRTESNGIHTLTHTQTDTGTGTDMHVCVACARSRPDSKRVGHC